MVDLIEGYFAPHASNDAAGRNAEAKDIAPATTPSDWSNIVFAADYCAQARRDHTDPAAP